MRSFILAFFLSISALASANSNSLLRRGSCGTREFVNPIYNQFAADPYVAEYAGYWYMTRTMQDQASVRILRSSMLHTWSDASVVEVFRPQTLGSYSITGPELHNINDNWYIYFTGTNISSSQTANQPGIFVLQSLTASPQGPYTSLGQLQLPSVSASDPTLLQYLSSIYLIYTSGKNLYITELNDPLTPASGIAVLAEATLTWESGSVKGAQTFTFGTNTYIAYNTGGQNPVTGLLALSTNNNANPTNSSSWSKSQKPFISKKGVSLGAVVSAGSETWIIYSAGGSSTLYPRAQKITTGPKPVSIPKNGCIAWPQVDGKVVY